MRKWIGDIPPRYGEMLRLTLAAALLRLVPLIPVAAAYYLLPVGSWLRLLLLSCPVLWIFVVCPARVRYGDALAALAADDTAPLGAGQMLKWREGWRGVCLGRITLIRRWALPLAILLVLLVLLFWIGGTYTAVGILLHSFGGVATVIGAVGMFLPRLAIGESIVQPAGLLGGMGVLLAVLALCLTLFGLGAFRSAGYRFGYTAGMPHVRDRKLLLKQNLRLWLPTLALLCILLLFAYQELGLLFANLLGAALLFSVTLQIHQIVLLVLTTVLYLLLLPIRKWNTAVWAHKDATHEE